MVKFLAAMHIHAKSEWLQVAIDFAKLHYQGNEVLSDFLHEFCAYDFSFKCCNVAEIKQKLVLYNRFV